MHSELYPLSLHDALPISAKFLAVCGKGSIRAWVSLVKRMVRDSEAEGPLPGRSAPDNVPAIKRVDCRIKSFLDIMTDRKSTRLNSSHVAISYAVFCLKKK